MSRMTFEEWWAIDDNSAPNPKEYARQAWQAAINSQSLSQEAVRNEALDKGDKLMQAKLSGFNEGLEEAARVCENPKLWDHTLWCSDAQKCAHAIRALKREPNAAAQADLGPETDERRDDLLAGPSAEAQFTRTPMREPGVQSPEAKSHRGARAGNVVAWPATVACPDPQACKQANRCLGAPPCYKFEAMTGGPR